MPRRRLPPSAPCPCDSGKKYKDCCHDKGFEWQVDDEGNIFKSIPFAEDLAEVIEEQRQKFVEQHGREPGPDDSLFFDMPPLEHAEHFMVQAMEQAGLHPAFVYAFEKTGLIVTEENQNLLSEKDLAEWEAAIQEYEARQDEEKPPVDEENEYF
jgi:hypothetical protein